MSIASNVSLAERTSLGLGGPARHFVVARDEAELVESFAWAAEHAQPVWVLGGGSNIVVPDSGVAGLVIAMAISGIDAEDADTSTLLAVGAGEAWDDLVRFSVGRGLSGLECLSGIPGSVGATPIQNVGAYGQEIAESLRRVRAFDRATQRFVELDNAECEFGYRTSRFKAREPDRYVITRVWFELQRGEPRKLRYPELVNALAGAAAVTGTAVREAVLRLRRGKSMLLDPNDENGRSCGSFFVNPVVERAHADALAARYASFAMPRYPQADGSIKLSAAWLIERAGFVKGQRAGNVGISTRHALALVAHRDATSSELIAFADEVARRVLAETGVGITPEPVLW